LIKATCCTKRRFLRPFLSFLFLPALRRESSLTRIRGGPELSEPGKARQQNSKQHWGQAPQMTNERTGGISWKEHCTGNGVRILFLASFGFFFLRPSTFVLPRSQSDLAQKGVNVTAPFLLLLHSRCFSLVSLFCSFLLVLVPGGGTRSFSLSLPAELSLVCSGVFSFSRSCSGRLAQRLGPETPTDRHSCTETESSVAR
jgi:hypothetical protein